MFVFINYNFGVIMLVEFKGLNNNGNVVHVSFDLPQDIEKYDGKNQNLNLTLKRIVCEILKTSSTTQKVHVSLKDISQPNGKLFYEIKNEPNSPLHFLTLQFNTSIAVTEILQRKIEEIDQHIVAQQALDSILDRFSYTENKVARTPFEKIMKLLGDFFEKIKAAFHHLSMLFRGINPEGEQLKWDLTLLSEVCGSAHVDQLTMEQSLKYMSKMMAREQPNSIDVRLHQRIRGAAKIAQKITNLREHFSKGNCKGLIKQVKGLVESLSGEKKILIPVGYYENGTLVEMLLEISKDPKGKNYTVTLISASKETRSFFDQEVGLETSSQSMRREIANVEEKDLLAAIPTFIELQTTPECKMTADTSQWRNTFLQALRFHGSSVSVDQSTEEYFEDLAPGHLRETISYAKSAQKTPEDAKRFELSARLQFFLDICKNNQKGLKNPQFWTLIRTTALQLVKLIEEDKRIIGSKTMQGIELNRIYGELNGILSLLDVTLPQLTNLRMKIIPEFSGPIDVVAQPAAPLLVPMVKQPNVYPKTDLVLKPLDESNPIQSVVDWGSRCRELISNGKIELAANEALLMVRFLPNPTSIFWSALDSEQSALVAKSLAEMGEAIIRQSLSSGNKATLHEIAALAALNGYAYTLTSKHLQNPNELKALVYLADKVVDDLMQSRLVNQEKEWLFDIASKHIPKDALGKQLPFSLDRESLQPLVNINQFLALSLGVYGKNLSPIPSTPLDFKIKNRVVSLEGSSWKESFQNYYKNPLALHTPEYAKDVSLEISNRYLTEFCCLGCIRDNCPNYNMVEKNQHRFHPLYMLHNFVDQFCENLIKRGLLYRDEVSDLMYTQQTNQNANDLWVNKHGSQHGFDLAHGFNLEDYRIQLMNTFTVFLDHPHFFKLPDLRWQFETKVFSNQAFIALFQGNQEEFLPFTLSAINKLKKEITLAHAGGDVDMAAYLLNLVDEIKSVVKTPGLMKEEARDAILSAINFDADELIFKWSQDLISKSDDGSKEKQKMVLSILLSRYFKKFCADPNDSIFSKRQTIEMVFAAIGRLESIEKGKDKIDPEIRSQYNALMAWMLPKAKECIAKEITTGDFTNMILFYINPTVGALRLQWEPQDFPTMLALDESGEFYQFDLLTGSLSFGKVAAEEIPENIKQNQSLQQIFGEALNENWKKFASPPNVAASGVTAYTHPKFPDYRLLIKKADANAKKGLIEGNYQIVIEKTIQLPQSLQHPYGSKEVFTFVRFDEQGRLLSEQGLSSASDLPPEVVLAIKDRPCWINKKKSCVHVFEADNITPFAVMNLKQKKFYNQPPITMISEIHFHDGTDLLDANERELEAFTPIEDARFIQVTGKNKKAETISYVRYELATGAPLVYKLTDQKISSKAFPGYSLEAFGMRPGNRDPAVGVKPLPDTFDGFHLLTRGGAQKVLIPLREYQQELSFSGEALAKTNAIPSDSYKKRTLFEYDLDPETNRLIAKSGDGYAYLAYLSFVHWDYSSASYYLEKAFSSAGYDKNYETIFEWANDIKDDNPNGTAMLLRFELFREKTLDDRKLQKIKEGKISAVGEIDFNRMSRLKKIADLYEKYSLSLSNRIFGESGSDPSLDLSPGDEQYTAFLIKELLENHGKDVVETHEPKPVRAHQVAMQVYPKDEGIDRLGVSVAAQAIWVYKGNSISTSPLTLQDPEWIVENFQGLFNQLLESDPSSLEFKQIEHQVRLLAERERHPHTAVDQAQIYLLKLISAKKLDPAFVNSLKQMLGPEEKLPKIKGSLFKNSRSNRYQRMEQALIEFDKFALRVPKRCLDVCVQLKNLDRKGDPNDLRGLGRRGTKFIQQWQAKKDGTDFYEEFRKFLIHEIYGVDGAQSIENLSNLFTMLDPIPISQPDQRLAPSPTPSKKPSQTYSEKYAPLLDRHQQVVNATKIEILENEVLSAVEPAPDPKIVTKPALISTILENQTIAGLNQFFQVTKKPSVNISEAVFDDLAASPEKAFVRLAEDNRADLKVYVDESKTVSTTRMEVEQVQNVIEKTLLDVKEEKNLARSQLLQFVERFNTPAGILAMRRLVGKGSKPSLDYLIALWRRNEIDQPWDNHPFKQLGMVKLSPEMLRDLDQSLAKYLELTTKEQHLQRVTELTTSYLDTCAQQPSAVGDVHLAENLYDAIQTKRYFSLDPKDSPDFRDLLFLEFTQQVILHSQQVDTIRDMLDDPNAVRQLRMGGGKSKVLLPILAKRKANGANLVMLMLPEELYETNCKDLDNTNKQLFGQKMHRFDFTRKTDKSSDSLTKIYARLLTTVQDKGFVMTTKRSMLSIKNSYVEMLYKLQSPTAMNPNDRAELISQIRVMSKILKLFLDKTDVIADEVDACLDVRKEVNFSLGDSEHIDEIKTNVGTDLMSLVLETKENEPLYEIRESLQKNTQAAISPEKREQLMRTLTGVYYDKNANKFNRIGREQFIAYIMNDKGSEETEALVLSMRDLGGHNALFKEIATVKAFINRGFGTTLGRVGNVNYGRDPITELWTIPYKASNTPHIGSEFDDEIEQISFTIQDYLQNGVEYKQVYQVIARMRNKGLEELRKKDSDHFITLNETEAGKEFLTFINEVDPNHILGTNITLSSVYNPKTIEALVAAINSTPEGKLGYCHKQVIRNIRQYSAQINSVSTDLPDIVRNFSGFTGTPWNRYAYHDKIHAEKKLGVDGSTWALMLGRDVKTPTFDFNPDKPIESLLVNLGIVGNFQATVDTGAYLRGTNNQEFIDQSLKIAQEQGKKVAAGIYFDETGRIVKKSSPDEAALLLEVALATDLFDNITLYDQAHTFGADIKQDRKATAVVTIGENTFIRDLFQSVWRLRKLNQEQRVVLAVSNKIKERILNGEKRELTKEDIYKFCLMNEARREADDNFRSEREKIQGLTKRTALSKTAGLITDAVSDEQIIKIAKGIASEEAELFIKVRPKETAYDQYAALKKEQDPLVLFETLRQVEKLKCLRVAKIFEPIDPKTQGDFVALGDAIEKRPSPPENLFPNQVESVLIGGGEVEQEAQAETEQELELLLEAEVEQETEVLNEVLIPMVQSGEAGHGNVNPLDENMIDSVADKGNAAGTNGMLRQLNHSVNYFDSEIYTSAVFERNFVIGKGRRISPQCAFYSNRKPVKHVLIIKKTKPNSSWFSNNSSSQWSMVIPTIHEAHGACRKFINKAGNDVEAVQVALSPTRPVMMYKTGKDRTDQLPFTDKADQDQFYRLYIQAKLFNGEIEFTTDEEVEALKAWLVEKGPEEFKGYFEKNILAAKPRRFADNYQKSSLFKIFNELCVPALATT